ncbi:hypothetical protein CQA66_00185 [Helicobacter aurati]|uniref:Uncharacterized protein n=1 Tax=Helicobacter aurati TaxID=137778 RepID=A0A3D8J8N8_9HELI|nr:hypothetical protein [Helicobacter aurati]RDU73650.1 hypothetical protein CQA66_00185 [Helicobacter aurati]
MHDDVVIKEYLKFHGVENVLDLEFEELKEKYEQVVRDGVSYYRDILYSDDVDAEILDIGKKDTVEALKKIENTEELYSKLHEFLYRYVPTDLIALMSELKMPVSYNRLRKIVAIVHAMVQDEILDTIKFDLHTFPQQERETLIAYYENQRDDIMMLQKLHAKYKSMGMLEYLRDTAETKLVIMQTFLPRDLESEYKPFYDNSKEKQTLISKILEISGIYTKQELFNMQIAQLQVTYQEIMEQVLQKEREQKLMKKYIEIFEDSAGITEYDFKLHCHEMQANLPSEIINEVINHFMTRNHFIANKINNVFSGKNINQAPQALDM